MTTESLGITGYGVYLPVWRLDRSDIGSALGAGGGRGTRSVAGYDEDSTSMGVGAGLAALDGTASPDELVFATATPAYADKTNATAVHAALALDRSAAAYDIVGAPRGGMGALSAAADAAAAGRSTLAVLSDIRTGLPGSAEERDGGDGAAAILFGTGDGVVAELRGRGNATAEFLERWRIPGEKASRVWEERFAEGIYRELTADAVDSAVKAAGLTLADVDRIAVSGVHRRAVGVVAKSLAANIDGGVLVEDMTGSIGATGTAQPGIMLAGALDSADADEVILLVQLADGVSAMVFRTTPALRTYRERRSAPTVSDQIDGMPVPYNRFLTWRGFLDRAPPRRPDPDRPAAPPAARNSEWKFALSGSRCSECGTLHLPAVRVCRNCHSVDHMTRKRMAGEHGTIATYQADLLAFSPSPPLVGAAINFAGDDENGTSAGRLMCEITDADPNALKIGDAVEMTFRRLYTTADGVPNYFWKARPVRASRG